jgi:hypothetical protein
MPHVGPVSEGRTFFCPHCGAFYSMTRAQLAGSDSLPRANRIRFATGTARGIDYNSESAAPFFVRRGLGQGALLIRDIRARTHKSGAVSAAR